MRKKTTLTKRQIVLIEDLLTTELEEKDVLEKHNVSPILYTRWHAEKAFVEHFENRIAAVRRHTAAVIARQASKAAERLAGLTADGTGETARKACLDLINMQQPEPTGKAASRPTPKTPAPQSPQQHTTIPPKTAEKILAILAQEKDKPDEEG